MFNYYSVLAASQLFFTFLWSTGNTTDYNFALLWLNGLISHFCCYQWRLSKLCAVSALRAGIRSLVLWASRAKSWLATQRSMTCLRFRTPTSSSPHLYGALLLTLINRGWDGHCGQNALCYFLGEMGQHDKKMEGQLSAAACQALPYWWGQMLNSDLYKNSLLFCLCNFCSVCVNVGHVAWRDIVRFYLYFLGGSGLHKNV